MPRPIVAAPPAEHASSNVPDDVGLELLPAPDVAPNPSAQDFPALDLPTASVYGIEMSGVDLPDLPDFFL